MTVVKFEELGEGNEKKSKLALIYFARSLKETEEEH